MGLLQNRIWPGSVFILWCSSDVPAFGEQVSRQLRAHVAEGTVVRGQYL
jgi:hypothetical protein